MYEPTEGVSPEIFVDNKSGFSKSTQPSKEESKKKKKPKKK